VSRDFEVHRPEQTTDRKGGETAGHTGVSRLRDGDTASQRAHGERKRRETGSNPGQPNPQIKGDYSRRIEVKTC
jgi:hypothetical protein